MFNKQIIDAIAHSIAIQLLCETKSVGLQGFWAMQKGSYSQWKILFQLNVYLDVDCYGYEQDILSKCFQMSFNGN